MEVRVLSPALAATLVTASLALAGCGGHGGARGQLKDLRRSDVPYFYLGESFAGLPVTHAEGDARGGFVVYGDCTPPTGPDAGGCAPPVQVQTKLCSDRTAAVAIFFGEGSEKLGPHRVARAKRAVRPLNAAARRVRAPMPSYDSMRC